MRRGDTAATEQVRLGKTIGAERKASVFAYECLYACDSEKHESVSYTVFGPELIKNSLAVAPVHCKSNSSSTEDY